MKTDDSSPQRRLLSMSVSLLITAALGACSFAPPYERPASPVPVQYPNIDHSQPTTTESLARLTWREFFTDPQLQALIERALRNNRNLAVMTLRIQEAQAQYGIERSSLYPGLRADLGAARIGLPAELGVTGQARAVSQYSAAAILSWEIDFWGRLRNLNEVALQNYLVSESSQQATALSVVTQVASLYYSLLALDEQNRIATEAVRARQRTYDLFKRRHEVGSGTKLEIVEAETLLTQAQDIVAELGMQRQTRMNQLAQVVGDYQPLEWSAQDSIATLALPELQPGLSSELLLYRPDIMAAENRLLAANASIGAARAAFFPNITLNAATASVSTELSNLFSNGTGLWLLSPSLSLPIFDGQRLQSNLTLAEVRKNIAVVEYEKTIETAFREVADSLAERHSLKQSVQIKQRAVAAQSERARLVRLKFERGSSSYFEVLDAQRLLLQVQQQSVQQQLALLLANVRMFAALGAEPVMQSVPELVTEVTVSEDEKS